MEKYTVAIIVVCIASCLTVLTALGKIDPSVVTPMLFGVLGLFIDLKKKPEEKPAAPAVPPLPLILLLLALSGCMASVAGRFDDAQLAGIKQRKTDHDVIVLNPADSAYCVGLDNKRVAWTVTEYFAGGLAGAGGLTTVAVEGHTEQLAIGLSTVAFGALAVGSGWAAQDAGKQWVRDCSQNAIIKKDGVK